MRAQHWTWDTVPFGFEPYWVYGALDTPLAAHLWRKFAPEVTGRFRASYDLERATARICAGMMSTGMMTDQPYIRRNISERLAYYEKAMAWLRSQFGISTVNSNEQVGRLLNSLGIPTLMWTDGGKPAIGKEALTFYASAFPQHAPVIRTIRTCRKTGDVVNKYLQKFLDLADSDGVIHPQIWTSKARTTRQSVTDPPMQTYDRDEPIVRGCYIPRPGNVFITIDADQIEARLAAHLSRDPQMIADFHYADQHGLKYFCVQASRIYNEEISKTDPRYTWTKNATYGQIYGGGLDKVAATAGVPLEQMRPVYVGFQQLYPGVGRRMAEHIQRLRKQGGRPEIYTLGGRRLYVDRGHEYAALNYEIQGSAAEILKRGQVEVAAAGYEQFLRLDIHDELLMEVPREQAQEILADVTRILTDRTNFAVPITWAGNVLTERWKKM
jgi:DNA polymerase-1